MKRTITIILSAGAIAVGAFAQQDEIDKALLAAPRQMKDGATVIKWKSDFTYDTLRKGTNRMVCFDRSGMPGQQPFAVMCTSIANLDREVQNMKAQAMGDRKTSEASLTKEEGDGSRVKPEFGSVWLHLSGADQEHAREHITVAVPGATAQSLGLPDNPKQGGIWIMNAGTSTAHLMIPGH